MQKIIVVGGGAAGMMAGLVAAKQGAQVTILEKNEKLGKKLYITGKGRCNLTNASEPDVFFENISRNPRFMYSAFDAFDNLAVISFFESLGVRLKTERGNRVFPVSDRSSDIISSLQMALKRHGVTVRLCTQVKGLCTCADPKIGEKSDSKKDRRRGRITGVRLSDGRVLEADCVIIACGGLSYPATGSTGDGLRFAEETGHSVTDCRPGLVPLEVLEPEAAFMQGLSLKNVTASFLLGKKLLYKEFGEMLFTHFGVSGPLILSGSSYVSKYLPEKQITLSIDLKPALSVEQLHKRLIRDFSEEPNKQFKNVIPSLFPAKLVPVMIGRTGISGGKKVSEITREERCRLAEETKAIRFTVTGTRGFDEAIITQGGVSVKDVDPSTMRSKLVEGLYFAGEVLDVDALTGGYNLQIAWSTAYAAGTAAAKEP